MSKTGWQWFIRAAMTMSISVSLASLVVMPASALEGTAITRTFQDSPVYSGTRDTYIDQAVSVANYGTETTMILSHKSALFKHAFVSFDVSVIPAGSTGIAGSLGLYLATAPSASRTYNASRVTSAWEETTLTYSLGHTMEMEPTDNATTGSVSGVWNTWTVTGDVSVFLAGTVSNYGWCITDANPSATGQAITGTYYAREYATPTLRPKLSVTFTAPWGSYSDAGRSLESNSFSSQGSTVYLKDTGYADGNYSVGYYDGNGTLRFTDSGLEITSGQDLTSHVIPKNISGAAAGTWRALVQPVGATAFPSSYADAVAAPDTYQLLGNDYFEVSASAIPEFPQAASALAVVLLCGGAYCWMRRGGRSE